MNTLTFDCTANHGHFSHPTALQREDCYFGRRKRTVAVPSSGAQARITAPAPTSLLVDNSCKPEESDSCASNSTRTGESDNNSYSVHSSGTNDNQSNNNQPVLDTHSYTTGATNTGGMLFGAVSTSVLVTTDRHECNPTELQARIELLNGKVALLQEQNGRLRRENKQL